VSGRDEIGRLSADLNYMTAELERLYRVERDGREAAEAVAARERELAAAKEFWAHTIVHDLRGPLNVIAGFTELLNSGRLGELSAEQRAAILQIAGSSAHVIGQVQDILDVFRLEQSALTLSGQRVVVWAVLTSAAAAARQPDRPVEVQVRIEPGCDEEIVADRRLLLRALDNLLQNAYKHAGSGARVALSARREPDGLITFAVDDDGPGIPPAARERVFSTFAQGSMGKDGAGLGLTFCYLVAKAHGGRVWVETSPLGGARVCLAIASGSVVGQLTLTDLSPR
jgi:signal transduction histidine kinase